MRPRAIKDLSQLEDAELFVEIAEGMRLCAANALRLWRDARKLLMANRHQGFSILRIFVEEEAAKFHILLDAVRCPRQPADVFARQLGYFNQHLAKGLYAIYHNMFRPAHLLEIRQYMDSARKTLYLDGPNDVDWVFQNEVLRKREEAIYVDYVDYADNYRRERSWHSPNPRLLAIGRWHPRPKVLDVALALHGIGVSDAAALAVIAGIWRATPMDDAVAWPSITELNLRTLEALQVGGLLRQRSDTAYRAARYDWLFPLFPLDLRQIEVDAEILLQTQRNCCPGDGY
jgi:AbiV family abortive infection protein